MSAVDAATALRQAADTLAGKVDGGCQCPRKVLADIAETVRGLVVVVDALRLVAVIDPEDMAWAHSWANASYALEEAAGHLDGMADGYPEVTT